MIGEGYDKLIKETPESAAAVKRAYKTIGFWKEQNGRQIPGTIDERKLAEKFPDEKHQELMRAAVELAECGRK